ncbi:MAG: thioredoxin family protein [Saprospiraceae bacterium]
MVRLNEQTNFHFPFQPSETSPTIQVSTASQLDNVDRVLSIFASTFFFAILIAITLDNSVGTDNISSTQLLPTFHPSMEYIVPLVSTKGEMEIQSNLATPISKNNILALAPSKLNSKENAPISNSNQSSFKEISNTKKRKISTSSKTFQKSKAHFNQPRISKKVKETIIKSSTQTTKVSPKPVFVGLEMESENLVINEKVTLDLLPLSYFHAKEKAAEEDKLMIIKFGAKWCLPCRQMEKTTFKDVRVKDFLEKNYASLSVDVDDFDGINMQSYFNVELLPTLLIFNSKGNFIAKYINYQSAASMLKILEKHNSEQQEILAPVSNKMVISPELNSPKKPKIVSIDFNKVILSKKKNGKAINFVKSKAKNWRYTQLDFSTKNFSEGELLLQVKETATGYNLTELNIPVTKNQGVADTTSTNFQLVLEHEKRKNKNGEYVVEIYHIIQDDLTLVGKTTLLKDGEILF